MKSKTYLFQKALEFIKENTGLILTTLLEKRDLMNRINHYFPFDIYLEWGGADIEAALSFLNENYNWGVYCWSDFNNYYIKREKLKDSLGFDMMAFQFKKMQEEKFYP